MTVMNRLGVRSLKTNVQRQTDVFVIRPFSKREETDSIVRQMIREFQKSSIWTDLEGGGGGVDTRQFVSTENTTLPMYSVKTFCENCRRETASRSDYIWSLWQNGRRVVVINVKIKSFNRLIRCIDRPF